MTVVCGLAACVARWGWSEGSAVFVKENELVAATQALTTVEEFHHQELKMSIDRVQGNQEARAKVDDQWRSEQREDMAAIRNELRIPRMGAR